MVCENGKRATGLYHFFGYEIKQSEFFITMLSDCTFNVTHLDIYHIDNRIPAVQANNMCYLTIILNIIYNKMGFAFI